MQNTKLIAQLGDIGSSVCLLCTKLQQNNFKSWQLVCLILLYIVLEQGGGGKNEPGQGDLFKLLSILSVFAAMILFYLSERGLGGGGGVGRAKVNVNVTFLSC